MSKTESVSLHLTIQACPLIIKLEEHYISGKILEAAKFSKCLVSNLELQSEEKSICNTEEPQVYI